MAVYVATVGLTILGNLPRYSEACGRDERRTRDCIAALQSWARDQQLNDYPQRAKAWLTEPPTDLVVRPVDEQGIALHEWAMPGLSAELDGLRHAPPAPPVREGDRVVLLASDSPKGALAALLNATLLGRDGVLWSGDPAHSQQAIDLPGVRGPSGIVDVVLIRELIPGEGRRFLRAMARIARVLAWTATLPEARDRGLVLHIAGGYKATIPFLMALAEFLPDVSSDVALPVAVYCKHEDGAYATPIPLRRPSVQTARGELATVASGRWPQGDRQLEHFAYYYNEQARRPDLTSIGEVLQELFEQADGIAHPHGS